MQTLIIDYEEDTRFCPLKHPYNKRFSDFVKMGVKPSSYRRWDAGSKCWKIHITRLPMIVTAGKRYFDHVDWSLLPEDLQIELVMKVKGGVEDESFLYRRPDLGPYATLHLLDSAPVEVVKAAYKALALKHHPDHGGNAEQFRLIQEAYEEIVKGNN